APCRNTSPAFGEGGQREMPRWSAARRDVPIARDVKTPRKRLGVPRKDAWVPRKHLASLGAPLPLARPQVRKEGGKKLKDCGAAGAAKQTAGGALRSEEIGYPVGARRSVICCHSERDSMSHISLIAALAFAAASATAAAEPTRPITMMVPFAAGGGS